MAAIAGQGVLFYLMRGRSGRLYWIEPEKRAEFLDLGWVDVATLLRDENAE